MQQQGNQSKPIEVKEIKRQWIHVPAGMSTREISEKYGLNMKAAYRAKKKDFS